MSLEVIGLAEIAMMWDKFLTEYPRSRREYIHNCGDIIEGHVRSRIGELRIRSENLTKAITRREGSGGGYVVVRNNNRIAPHCHLLEEGHKQTPGQFVSGYWTDPKMFINVKGMKTGMKHKKAYVKGYHMYYKAAEDAREEIYGGANEMMESVVEKAVG